MNKVALLLLGLATLGQAGRAASPELGFAVNAAGEVIIQWTGSGVLERSSQVNGPWEPLPEANRGWKTPPRPGSAFFRVRSAFPLEVTVAGAGMGVVTSAPAGIECATRCTRLFDEGVAVTLTPVPHAGSVFEEWTGVCDGQAACVIVMDGPKAVAATFGKVPAGGGLVNGDFEQGPGVGWLQQPSNMIYSAEELGLTPYSGRYAAWVGFHQDGRKSAAIGQEVTLPAAWPLYLNFAIWLYSEELCDPPWWDTFGVYVNGEPLQENPRLCSGNTGGDGWRRLSLDLSAYAGQRILIGFEISSVDALASVALLDDVSISGSPW